MLKFYSIFLSLLIFACQPQSREDNDTVPEKSLEGYWHQQPLRILQTVLRQPDAANYSVDSVVQYMQQVNANVLVINGGGIIDYFQNTLPMANVNPYIGKRDLLADIVEGCHQSGIKVIARVDFRGVHKERYDLHPDWFARDENNEPIILNYTTPGLYAPCYNGYYRNEHAVEFISRLFEKYNIDGIWHNAVNFHNVCYCDRCRDLYFKAYKDRIPVKISSKDEWERYYKWNEKMAGNQLAKMRATVKKYGEDKSYAAEVFDMYRVEQQKHTGINLYSAAEYFDFLVTVSFIANNSFPIDYKDIYYPSAIVRFLKSLEPDKPPVILFGGNGTEHRYIYDPPLDSRIWLWETAGTGGGFWNCYFNGSFPANTIDQRNAYLASDAYQYVLDNQPLIQDLQPVTDVAIFYSVASGHFLGDEDFSQPLKGIFRMLEEGHYQYGFVSDRQLTIDKLNQFKVLIMPNVVSLSDEHSGIILKWVEAGGNLMATFQTSLFDESGKPREDFGLANLFGVNYEEKIVNTETDCYQKIITRTTVLKGFEKTRLLHNSGRTLMVSPRPEATIITGYLPKINNQPPENAFPENWDSHNPIVVWNRFGKGEVVYFANEAARLNYTIGHPDYRDLLVNSINLLLKNHDILETNAPSSVHVYLNQSDKDQSLYQLSLVNTSSSTHRPLRDLVPVAGIEVHLPFIIKQHVALFDSEVTIRVDRNILYIDNLDEFCAIKLVR
jgi:hypothetical protein